MPKIDKARRRDVRRNKVARHRVHGRFDAQYNAMLNREVERQRDIQRDVAFATKQAVVEAAAR